MKFTLNNFYSNNYKDFIHLEALKNVLRKVPQLKLAGVENIDNILSMEFSVDDWGENPMYIKYIDSDGKKHIVKIRPSVTDQIYEILKPYAKITYVDEQDKKLKDELHTEITQGDENTLNLSKTYTDTVVNHAKDEINHTIETTKQDLKGYCDNKCEITLASSKEYTDTKAHELSQHIETGDTETLESSKNYTDTQLAGYETKADAKAEHDKLSAEAEKVKQEVTNNSNQITTVSQLVSANDNKTSQALADVNSRIDGLTIGTTNLLSKTSTKEISIDAPTKEWSESANYNTTRPLIEHEYVVSFEARGDIDEQIIGTFLWSGGLGGGSIVNSSVSSDGHTSTAKDGQTFVTLTTSWKKYWVKYKVTPDNTKKSVIVGRRWVDSNPNGKVYIRNVKLEEGNKATSWSPAPEDEIEHVSQLNENIKRKTTLYTTTEGETGETSYPRATFKKLTNGDISFNPGAPTDPSYGYLLNETQLTKLKNLNETPAEAPIDIKFNGNEDVTKIDFSPGNPDRVIVSTTEGVRLNASFITQGEKTNITNLLSWKTIVTNELTRMNGGVVDIPKEEFTPLNGLTIDHNTAFGRIFKFNNFAIIRLNVYVANITMPSWTFKEAVSFPKSYLAGFSKFMALNEKRQITDDNWGYDNSFDIGKCLLGFYTRGNEYNNKGIELSIAGMLYN